MIHLDTVKLRLIQQIMNLESESFLEQIETQIKTFVSRKEAPKEEAFWNAVRPIKKMPSIQEMVAVQNHKPTNRERFYGKVSQLKIEEPLDELLEIR